MSTTCRTRTRRSRISSPPTNGCRTLGITPYWTVDHGPTTSLYYRDPDGNQVELQIDNFDSVEALNDYFRSGAFNDNPIGVNIDVNDLVARVRSGSN